MPAGRWGAALGWGGGCRAARPGPGGDRPPAGAGCLLPSGRRLSCRACQCRPRPDEGACGDTPGGHPAQQRETGLLFSLSGGWSRCDDTPQTGPLNQRLSLSQFWAQKPQDWLLPRLRGGLSRAPVCWLTWGSWPSLFPKAGRMAFHSNASCRPPGNAVPLGDPGRAGGCGALETTEVVGVQVRRPPPRQVPLRVNRAAPPHSRCPKFLARPRPREEGPACLVRPPLPQVTCRWFEKAPAETRLAAPKGRAAGR